MKSQLILVVGASGTVGSEIVKNLKDRGYNVRTTTSKKTGLKPNQVYLNLQSGEGLKEAFVNVDRAFFLSPAGYADQYAILSPLIQESKRQGLKKVVLMTAMGVNFDDSNPLRRSEIELEKSGLQYNIIRPNWFMQNFNTFWLHNIQTEGKILLPAGDAKTSFIDARDISETASALLTNDIYSNQAFDLTGPEALTHDQVAMILSEQLGRKISYQDTDPQVFKSGLLQAGLPNDYADLLLFILEKLKAGYAAAVTDSVQKILGRPSKNFLTYAKDFQNSYK